MTKEKHSQLLRAGGDDAVDYWLGRECAMADTANGKSSLAKGCDLADVMGNSWAQGYTEYYNAWEVLNRA